MNVAIIGCGGMGSVHAQMAANCGLKVVVCADKRLSVATQCLGDKEYGVHRALIISYWLLRV